MRVFRKRPMRLDQAATPADDGTAARAAETPAHLGWAGLCLRLAGSLLCFTLGTFLLFFPWSVFWDDSYFSSISAGWYEVWNNSYLRGAISGLGVVNIYISLGELFRLRPPWRH